MPTGYPQDPENLDIKVSSLSNNPIRQAWFGSVMPTRIRKVPELNRKISLRVGEPILQAEIFQGPMEEGFNGSLRLEDFSALITLWPTRPGTSEQTLISHQDSTSGWSLFLDDEGCLAAELGKAGIQKFRLEGSLSKENGTRHGSLMMPKPPNSPLGRRFSIIEKRGPDRFLSDYAFEVFPRKFLS